MLLSLGFSLCKASEGLGPLTGFQNLSREKVGFCWLFVGPKETKAKAKLSGKTTRSHLYIESKNVKYIEAESGWHNQGRGGGEWEMWVKWHRAAVTWNEQVLRSNVQHDDYS